MSQEEGSNASSRLSNKTRRMSERKIKSLLKMVMFLQITLAAETDLVEGLTLK
jgi:hypothetical protein